MKSVLKNSLYLLLRFALVAFLSFTSYLLAAKYEFVSYILVVIYGFALLYFFSYTLWYEGDRDTNRVKIGQAPETLWKGFVSAAIVLIPIIIALAVSLFFISSTGPASEVWGLVRIILSSGGFYLFYVLFPLSPVGATVAVIFLYLIAIVCAGTGYILGYKRISVKETLKTRFSGIFRKNN